MKTYLIKLNNIFVEKIQHFFQIVGIFLLPIQPLIALLFFIIFVDTITGIIKAKKLKQQITSTKLSKVVGKLLLYNLSLITFFILDNFLFGEFIASFTSIQFFLTKMVAMFFATIELVSINENINAACKINLFQKFKQYIFKLKEVKNDIDDISTGNHL